MQKCVDTDLSIPEHFGGVYHVDCLAAKVERFHCWFLADERAAHAFDGRDLSAHEAHRVLTN